MASLLLLTWLTVALRHQVIEDDLALRVGQALNAHAVDRLAIASDGRDVRLSGELPASLPTDQVAQIAAAVWGVRTVDVSGLRPGAVAERDAALVARFDRSAIKRLGGSLANPMDAGTCQRMLARLTATGAVRFEVGAASPMSDSYPLLNDLAAVAYQCPKARLIIGAHTDAGAGRSDDLRLSQARAEAIERFFQLAGIPAERMQVVAFGGSQPIASNATAEGRAANRRITFEVVPLQ